MESLIKTPEFSAQYYIYLFCALSIIIFLRYLIFSGLYHYVFYILFKKQFRTRLLNSDIIHWDQSKLEIIRSLWSSLIFAALGISVLICWQFNIAKIYFNFSDYSLWWLPSSLVLGLFVQETYYYWLHRWMHKPNIYTLVHKWHHDSIETNSLTSFSFHPIESFFQALVIILIIIIIPMHVVVIGIFLLLMTVSGTINHAGVEVYPKWFVKSGLGKMLIGATHHDIHHKNMRYNFGLYFTFWDRIMGTEDPKFDKLIRSKIQENL